MAGERGQAGRSVAPTDARPDDRSGRFLGQPPRRSAWPGAAVLEPGQALGPIAADPLVAGGPADPELLGDGRHRPAVDHHPLHQELPTEDTETRTRMCHESLRPVWVPTPHTVPRGSRLSTTS
jgi:hypothetical protein